MANSPEQPLEPHPSHLTRLATLYADYQSQTVSKVALLACGDTKFFRRVERGQTCTVAKYNEARQWFSDHWPSGLEWPAETVRPEPTSRIDAAE